MPQFSQTEFPHSYSVFRQIESENRFLPEVLKKFVDSYLEKNCTDTILSIALCITFIESDNYTFISKDSRDETGAIHLKRCPVLATPELIIFEP